MICILENRRIIEGFVAAHPETEGMADEDLFGAFAFRDFPNHFNGVGDFSIKCGIAGIDDLARSVDGFVEFQFPI